MARYLLVCDVLDSTDVYLTATGFIKCANGANLELIPFQPTLMDLTYSQASELAGATALLFVVAWVFRFVIDHLTNKK